MIGRTPDGTANLREHLVRALDWRAAHLGLDEVVGRFGPDTYGARVRSLPYTAWQIVQHMRLTQRDILDFCRDANYREPRWPEDYWPAKDAPHRPAEWETALLSFHSDLADMKQFIADPSIDLFATIPHGDGQTYLREALLVIDHNAYHLGQLVILWRLLSS